MSEPSAVERGYRRLLAWYPRSFRDEQEDEMLAVLMAGARPGQRRPGLLETADLVSGAVTVRLLRALRARRENRRWADALAVFSFLAPVFLVIVAVLEVAAPYHLPRGSQPNPFIPFIDRMFGWRPEIGGLSLLGVAFFDVAVGLQLIVAGLALAGRRRMTLVAIAVSVLYWAVFGYGDHSVFRYGNLWVPDALQLLTAGAYLLGAAALLASPGPRRGRQLVTWRHWAALVPAAACVQASTLMVDANIMRVMLPQLFAISGYLVLSVVLAALTVGLAVTLKLNRCFLLLAAAMFYPYAVQLAFSGIPRSASYSTDLLSLPTPAHLAILFGPPILLACWAMLNAIRPHRPRVVISAGRQA
jgi:hypothetical protein